MSSPRKEITIVKKKEKSSFGLPLSTIGKKQGGKLQQPSVSPRKPDPFRAEAQSLVHVSPASSPPESPRAPAPPSFAPLTPLSASSSSPPPPPPSSASSSISADMDEDAFREFVAESMTRISAIGDPARRRAELAALQASASTFAQRVVSEKEKAEQEQKAAEEELARKKAEEKKKKSYVSTTQLSQISEQDAQEYERALLENKRLKEEEAKKAALLLKNRFRRGEIVYAEFAEDKLWYLAKVLECDGEWTTVEYVEYGGTAVCSADQVMPRIPGEDSEDYDVGVGNEGAPSSSSLLPTVESPALQRRSRGDSQWLAKIDRNLGSTFGATDVAPARARGDVSRALGAVAAMLEAKPEDHDDDGVSDSE